jgi:photosystem II stability/assembly factor-like uncharacterized protein
MKGVAAGIGRALGVLAAALLLAGCAASYSTKTMSLQDVSFANPSCGCIAGQYAHGGGPYRNGVVLTTHDGGATWETWRMAAAGIPDAVAFVNAKDGWVLSETLNRSFILATTDGGARWVKQYSGVVGLADLEFIDADHGWAVGTWGWGGGAPHLLTTTDGGATWTKRPAPGEAPFAPFFLNTRQGWIAEGVSGHRHIFATTDGGATWKKESLPGYSDIEDIAFANPRDGWAVGTDFLGERATIFATTDGGATWMRQLNRTFPIPYSSTNWAHNLVSVAVVDAKRVWAVGGDGLILATSNGGRTWQQQRSATAAWLGSVSFADARHGWIAGETDDGNGNFVSSVLLATTSGGETWTKQKLPGQ